MSSENTYGLTIQSRMYDNLQELKINECPSLINRHISKILPRSPAGYHNTDLVLAMSAHYGNDPVFNGNARTCGTDICGSNSYYRIRSGQTVPFNSVRMTNIVSFTVQDKRTEKLLQNLLHQSQMMSQELG